MSEPDTTAPAPAPARETLPMLPIKAGDVVKYTPRAAKKGETYHLKAPTISERAAIDREVAMRCGDPVDDRVLGLLLRRGVKELYPAAEVDEILSALNDRDDAIREGVRVTIDNVDQVAAWSAIERRVLGYRPFADAVTARSFRSTIMPLIAVQHMLVAWENVDEELDRKNGVSSEIAISRIPRDQYSEVWLQAIALLGLGISLAKN